MTLGNPDGAKDVPARTGQFRNEVLIQKGHRLSHDHALEMCGAKLVEVETSSDYESAFTPRTAMAFFLTRQRRGTSRTRTGCASRTRGGFLLSRCGRRCATDREPLELYEDGLRPRHVLGGKGIRGPQNAGCCLAVRI